jgi:hypothetical protein
MVVAEKHPAVQMQHIVMDAAAAAAAGNTDNCLVMLPDAVTEDYKIELPVNKELATSNQPLAADAGDVC